MSYGFQGKYGYFIFLSTTISKQIVITMLGSFTIEKANKTIGLCMCKGRLLRLLFLTNSAKQIFSWVEPIFAIHENMFQSVTIDLIDSQLIIVEY